MHEEERYKGRNITRELKNKTNIRNLFKNTSYRINIDTKTKKSDVPIKNITADYLQSPTQYRDFISVGFSNIIQNNYNAFVNILYKQRFTSDNNYQLIAPFILLKQHEIHEKHIILNIFENRNIIDEIYDNVMSKKPVDDDKIYFTKCDVKSIKVNLTIGKFSSPQSKYLIEILNIFPRWFLESTKSIKEI